MIPRDEKKVLSVKKLVYANEDEGLDAPGIDKEVDATDKKQTSLFFQKLEY